MTATHFITVDFKFLDNSLFKRMPKNAFWQYLWLRRFVIRKLDNEYYQKGFLACRVSTERLACLLGYKNPVSISNNNKFLKEVVKIIQTGRTNVYILGEWKEVLTGNGKRVVEVWYSDGLCDQSEDGGVKSELTHPVKSDLTDLVNPELTKRVKSTLIDNLQIDNTLKKKSDPLFKTLPEQAGEKTKSKAEPSIETKEKERNSPLNGLQEYYFEKLKTVVDNPAFNWGIAGKWLKGLMKTQTEQEIKQTMDRFFKSKEKFIISRGFRIEDFVQNYNAYKAGITGGQQDGRKQHPKSEPGKYDGLE